MATTYWVLHDWGTQGWGIQAECVSLREAVEARERDLRNGGGRVEIVELIPVLSAYRRADYEAEREK